MGAEQATAASITTFIFRVRNVPAALYKALGGFATNGVNMTKLESYQLDGPSPPRSSMPISRAIPTRGRCACAGGAAFFSSEVTVLGTSLEKNFSSSSASATGRSAGWPSISA